ncbi:MAG: DegT/DnrJ/EryC1/StrS family aminotransferase [Desertimonas sp.]
MSRRPILLSPPDIRGAEREAVAAALDGGWLAPVGPDLDAFEVELAAVCATTEAVGLSSGTAGLHLALHAHGVGVGDDVLVASLTFAATANAVVYTRARPVFVDADATSWCLDADLVVEELEARARRGSLPRAVVAVDLYGVGPDYDRLEAACRRFEVLLVEDAAEAIGSQINGRPAGSFGDVGVLSFNGNKLITTSGGGALVTNDAQLADRVRYLSTQARRPAAHYEHDEVGFNYRLSNVLAALGRAQLATLAERIDDRRAVRRFYAERLAHIDGVTLNPIPVGQAPNCWLTCVVVDPSVAPFSAAGLIAALAAEDIESRPLWKPMHRQPMFADAPHLGGAVSDRLFHTGVALASNPRQDGFYDRIGAVLDRLG